MITSWMIYFIGMVDSLRGILEAVYFFGIIPIFGLCIGFFVSLDKNAGMSKLEGLVIRKWLKITLSIYILVVCSYTFIPNSKTLAAMYVIPAIANNEKLQSIGSNGIEILEELTGKWLKELQLEKKKRNNSKEEI